LTFTFPDPPRRSVHIVEDRARKAARLIAEAKARAESDVNEYTGAVRVPPISQGGLVVWHFARLLTE
jgi:hypothetical protein